MLKIYDILLGQNKIGTTELEKADASIGVAFGEIKLVNITSGYKFLKKYCLKNRIEFTEYPEEKLISTRDIPNLTIIDSEGIEVKGIGTNVSGMDSDTFDVTVLGIPYPFYEREFPHHVKAYSQRFL